RARSSWPSPPPPASGLPTLAELPGVRGRRLPRTVLAQKLHAVVVAVRRPHDDVHVIGVRGTAVLRRPVIELDQDHRSEYAMVVRTTRCIAADPGEVGAIEVLLRLRQPGFGMSFAEVAHVQGDEVDEPRALLLVHERGRDANV